MRLIDAATTRRHLAFGPLIEALRDGFAGGAEVPPRQKLSIAGRDGVEVGSVLLMPAWRPGGRFGVKTVAIHPGNPARGLAALQASYLLSDATTGVPLALLDGGEITARRTAAVAALAASYLAAPDARRLLVVGAGRIATLLPEAMRCVRPIDRVLVWNHRPEGALALADRLRADGVDAAATADLALAVSESDIVSCATLSHRALIEGRWLRSGSHLDLVGSFAPGMREADAAAVGGARVFVDTGEALDKAGDLLDAIGEGAWTPERLQGTLADLCAGRRDGRQGGERTLFKSVGTALADLVAAEIVFDATGSGGPAASLS